MLVDILAAILVGGPFLALVVLRWFRPSPEPSDEECDWSDVVVDVIETLLD
jgi:hypothetical protein